MTDRLRTPFLTVAWICLLLALLVESGSNHFAWLQSSVTTISSATLDAVESAFPAASRPSTEQIQNQINALRQSNGQPPGYGIPDLAILDGLLLFSVTLTALAIFTPDRVQGRLQGILTVVVAIIVAIIGVARLLVSFGALMALTTLLLAAPFGTLAYFALFGFFDRNGAGHILSTLMFLKVAFAVLLILAQQKFLKIKSLLALIVFSLLLNIVTAFLQGFVPGFLASITDAIAGIINSAVGLIWCIPYLIAGLIATIKSLRMDRAGERTAG